jgi:type IV fimbrial biogenesis protein FimT
MNREFVRRHLLGFTLLELMVAITIGALLLGIGIPSFRSYLRSAELTSTANDLLGSFYLARGEAVKRRRNVVVCFSAVPEATTPACSAGVRRAGWVVFQDTNANRTVDAGEAILQRHAVPGTEVGFGSIPAGNAGYFAYAPTGFGVTLAAGAPVAGIAICDSRGNASANGADLSRARGIVVSAAGRPRVTRSVAEIAGASIGGCP